MDLLRKRQRLSLKTNWWQHDTYIKQTGNNTYNKLAKIRISNNNNIRLKLNHEEKWLNVVYTPPSCDLSDVKPDSEGCKVIKPWVKNGLFSTFPGFSQEKQYYEQYYEGALEQLQKLSCGHTPAANLDKL